MLKMSVLKKDNLILNLKDRILGITQNLHTMYLGRVLTVIDSCIQDPEQRKAIKDLIKDRFYSEEHYTNDLAEILYQFDEVSELHLISDDTIYRDLFGYSTQLAKKDAIDSPPTPKYF